VTRVVFAQEAQVTLNPGAEGAVPARLVGRCRVDEAL
jgi:hypothetical protein